MASRKPTIKDVAASANVHPSTVSRVLNPETRSMVSSAVADRITAIAAEMGYARSPIASGLRTGKSYTVGVLIPDLSNPIFPLVVRGIERALATEGFIAILADSDNSQKSELAILDSMMARNVDGLILATAHLVDPVVERCIRDRLPLVLVNRTVEGAAVSAVVNDELKGIELAVGHLLELGHERIAYLGGPIDTSTGRDRLEAFESLARQGRFVLDPDLCVNAGAFTEVAGYAGMTAILDRRKAFSAVVAANDLLALGCYDALARRGLSCPRDVSVTGFNDMPFVDRLSPALSTVRIPLDELGVEAAGLLLSEINGDLDSPRVVNLDPTLIVRQSTAPPS